MHIFERSERCTKQGVNHAISMLQTESGKTQPLSDIAHASGFGSLSSFNRAFKKHKGVTISTFKKEN